MFSGLASLLVEESSGSSDGTDINRPGASLFFYRRHA